MDVLAPFEFQLATRLVFGVGASARAGELAAARGVRRVLLVTDAGVAAAGHAERVAASLRAAGIAVTVFADTHANPSTDDVAAALAVAQTAGVDGFVAVGGGSSLDTAKGANFLLTNGGRMADYWGAGKAAKPLLPLIAVPTTAGTGSEVQSYALISDAATHRKMACGDPKAAPCVALLDPALTVSQPPQVTAIAGIDAVAHAVEAMVTRTATELSRLFAREAFRLTATHLAQAVAEPTDLAARAAMQLGACYAGVAIEHSMLGAAHAAANPLTERYGVPHGLAVAAMLPAVVRFNGKLPAVAQAYLALLQGAGLAAPDGPADEAPGRLIEALEELLAAARIPPRPDRRTCPADAALAAAAAAQWTAQHNPRPVTAADFQGLYAAALSPLGV